MVTITRDQVYAVVKRHLLETIDDLKEDQIDPVRSMKDLGANSLDIIEVVSLSMRELKVKVPRAELAKLTNLEGLVDLLYTVANEPPEARSA
jgi:acyl carrier protein